MHQRHDHQWVFNPQNAVFVCFAWMMVVSKVFGGWVYTTYIHQTSDNLAGLLKWIPSRTIVARTRLVILRVYYEWWCFCDFPAQTYSLAVWATDCENWESPAKYRQTLDTLYRPFLTPPPPRKAISMLFKFFTVNWRNKSANRNEWIKLKTQLMLITWWIQEKTPYVNQMLLSLSPAEVWEYRCVLDR